MNAQLVIQALALVNGLIKMAGDSQEYRAAIAKALAEGRDITEDELVTAENDAFAAIDAARGDN